MIKLSSFSLGLLLCFNMTASAASYSGYKRKPTSEVIRYTETVDRFSETQSDFLILISQHAALYRFPKKIEYTDQVRDFLNTRMKQKSPVLFEVDPTTAEILNVSDAKN